MDITRRPFQGILNILSFNRHFYYGGLVALAIILSGLYLFDLGWVWSTIILGGFCYGLLMPLIVSAYVYDLSGYYDLDWLDGEVDKNLAADAPLHLINIHAGFDETSFILKEKIPNSTLQVFDFYDDERHTEAAIVRARKVSLTYPNTTSVDPDHLPVHDHTADYVFLLSAAHEIRNMDDKIKFLKECRRICKPIGKIIMVEHLRDFPNFVAFTIGFTHFFSRKTWKDAFRAAGYSPVKEKKFTPFMSVFTASV